MTYGEVSLADRLIQTDRHGLRYPTRFRSIEEEVADPWISLLILGGGTLLKPGTETEWGGYVGYFADPDRFLWEIAWNPGFPLREDGSIDLP